MKTSCSEQGRREGEKERRREGVFVRNFQLAAQQGAGCAGRRIAFIAFAARLPGKHNMPGDTNILRGHQAVISAIKSFNSDI